jgi:hypothetical protein
MILKDTVPIIFNGGAYGTYLEYLLDTFTNQGTQSFKGSPFNNNGNAHQYTGQPLIDISGWQKYIEQGNYYKFVRFHPKVNSSEEVEINILKTVESVDRAILLYPTESTTVLNLNNFYYKIWESWLTHEFKNTIPISKIYKNWPVKPGTNIEQIPKWIIREFLSLYLMPAWIDQVAWNLLDRFSHPKVLTITMPELLFDVTNTIDRICQFCELSLDTDYQTLINTHQTMLSYQKNLHKDSLCSKIVQCTIESIDFDYSNETLTLIDEVWIQWKLRQLGYELQCNNLDQFPVSTTELANKIYQA